jgi:hypothetical protein
LASRREPLFMPTAGHQEGANNRLRRVELGQFGTLLLLLRNPLPQR